MNRPARTTITAALAVALAAACSDKPKQPTTKELIEELRKSRSAEGTCKPPPLEVFIQAAAKLNQNAKGQSMPVEVRVLLLKDRSRFDSLDFDAIWRDEKQALGKDLAKSASMTVFPGKLKIFPMESAPGTAYVGLVAVFRKPRRWRLVVDVRERNKRCAGDSDLHTIIHAGLQGYSITQPRKDQQAKP